jgi:ribonuclease HI
VALSDDLQLQRCLPTRDQDHPGDPRGEQRDGRTTALSADDGTLFGDLGGPEAGAPPVEPERPLGFLIRTDGAARGNPGPASAGAALYDLRRPDARDPRATPDASISEYLGIQTNNVAEYTGLVRALDLARELGAVEVHLLLDSKLIVEQVSGRWRVKDAKLIPLWAACRGTLGGFRRWTATHVPRAQNTVADALANEAIDRAQAGGPASVVRRPAAD